MRLGARATATVLCFTALLASPNVLFPAASSAAAPAPAGSAKSGSTVAGPTSSQLKADADQLRSAVDALRLSAEVATEDYDTAVSQAQDAGRAEIRAQLALDAASGTQLSRRADATRRIRSLYMGGGSLLGLATVVSTGDLSAAAERLRVVRSVLATDSATVRNADAATARAARAELALTRLRVAKLSAERTAAQAKTQVEATLLAQQQLLAAADRAVVVAEAAEEERVRQQALAAAAASAALAGVVDDPVARHIQSASDNASGASPIAEDAPPAAGYASSAAAAIAAAWTRQGLAYVWGATGPGTFDCSGLTQWAYGQAGITIPRTSREQYADLPKVALTALQPGDLVFYATGADPGSIHHVALYLGEGKVLHAPHTGDVVRVAGVAMDGLYGAVRPALP